MTKPPDNRIDDKPGGPRQETAAPQGAMAVTFTRWIQNALATVDGALASIVHWQTVSRTVQSLLSLDDAALKAMGLERNEVVMRVLQDARAKRTPAAPVEFRSAPRPARRHRNRQ